MKYPRMLLIASMLGTGILISGGFSSVTQDANDHGKLIVQAQCTQCHNLRRVKALIGKLDTSGWTGILNKMEKNGAKLSLEQKDTVIKFLSTAPSPSALE